MENPAHLAINFILTNASKYAQAKATRVQLEEYRKSKKAILMSQEEGTLGNKEMYAYAHADYVALLMQIKDAIALEEELRWKLEAAKLRVEVWKTEEYTKRAEMKL
jgi:predicted O-linked N-acetylglucosamine transferase (SPINDLY family)